MKSKCLKTLILVAVLCLGMRDVWAVETTDGQPFLGKRADKIKGRLEQMARDNPQEFETFFDNIRTIRKTNLAQIKETNPELFNQIKKERHEKLGQLKQNSPERYEKIMEHKGFNRKRHLKWMEENHPEAFEALKNAPGETLHDRLQYLNQQNPELAEKLRGERKEFLKEKWRSATPEERKKWAKNHPRAAERFEHLKEKRNVERNGAERSSARAKQRQ